MKITKRQLRRIIKEEKGRLLEGYQEERAKAAALPKPPAPQFPKMTYPEDRAKARDPAVALEGIVTAIMHARSLGVSEADIVATIKNEVGTIQENIVDGYDEGTSLEQMPDAWRQVLKNTF